MEKVEFGPPLCMFWDQNEEGDQTQHSGIIVISSDITDVFEFGIEVGPRFLRADLGFVHINQKSLREDCDKTIGSQINSCNS